MLISSLLANKCEQKTLDLKITNISVKLYSIIKNIAKDCQYSVFLKDGGELIKKKKIGLISINNKTSNEIIDFLLTRNNFLYTLENRVLTISKYTTKTFKVNYIDSTRVGKSNTDVSIAVSSIAANQDSGKTGAKIDTTETFDFWSELEDEIEKIIIRPEEIDDKDPSIVINKKAGFVTITGTIIQLNRVENYLKQLIETLKRQVVIDVKILSVTLDNSNKTGIDWSKLSLDLYSIDPDTSSFKTESNFQVGGLLNFLRSNGKTKSLSSPKILAMNNQPTLISIGDNINYLKRTSSTSTTTTVVTQTSTVENIFIGVLLDITPQIEESGYITLRINPSISEFKYPEDSTKQQTSRNLPPDTVSRRISSVIRVKDKETIILGGLISSAKSKKINKIWLLGDIPFLGWFFKSEQIVDVTTEIVFILTPRIITQEEQVMLKTLGFKGL
jgi:general secretion pathway protein D